MSRKLAAMIVLPLMIASPVPAHADPADVIDPGANYTVFLKQIDRDGIDVHGQQAISEALTVCTLMQPPNDASLWDAGQHVLRTHPDWKVGSALTFSDRAVQNFCPNRGSF